MGPLWAIHLCADRQLEFTGGLRYTDDEKDAFLFNENLGMTSVEQQLGERSRLGQPKHICST